MSTSLALLATIALAATPWGEGSQVASGHRGRHDGARSLGGDGDGGSAEAATLVPGDARYWLVTDTRPVVEAHRAGAGAEHHPPAPGEPPDSDFDRLAQCESTSRWHLDTGNGYYGGLQFSPTTWRGLGGTGLPNEHPREIQIELGRRQWRRSGWRAWPHCSKELGLA